MDPETLALCDRGVELPMQGLKESLNVAVAFGVIAYQLAARVALPA
ncbi:MAG TPA: TrmH family RNA methyltransferase [Candidatus Krumholzibacteria bacterium]|nr:TrmH family RNA methyltransferase [Candidatus Krumholzibacteria bacterium]